MREISTVATKLCRTVAQNFSEWTTKVIHWVTILINTLLKII